MNEHAAKLEAFWKAYESGDLARAEQSFAPDCEMTMPGLPPMKGAAAVRATFEAWRAALPDMRHETVTAVESGDTYAGETRFTATHLGPLRTPAGELPPTRRSVSWQSADVVRFKDGRIASWHVYHDAGALLAQLR